jgi:DNA-binding IclR family transcriptional regulator
LLLEDLKSIGQRGYTVSSGERVPDAAASGVAIFDDNGEMQGVLNLTAPIAPLEVLHNWGQRLIDALRAAGVAHLTLDRLQ